MEAPAMWRGTTVQVCGLWPFAAGSGSPSCGAPLGQNLLTGVTVCGDPISWFTRARLITNPSLFVKGRPGTGKSTLVNRMLLYLAATGVTPLVLGDLKPDYTATVAHLGGQVIPIGRGVGGINILDPGEMGAAAGTIGGKAGEQLRAEAHGRTLAIAAALITLVRGRPVDDHEQTVLAACLHHLAERHPASSPPTLPDLVTVLEEGPERVRAVTLDRGSERRYRVAVDPLHRSLLGLLDGPLGRVFGSPTTTRINLDAPAAAVDISRIGEADAQLTAAAMLAAWSDGLGCVAAAHALADAGLARPRWYFAVLDELWRPLRAAGGLVDRIDAITRLNRTWGLGQAMITHTLKDLEAVNSAADRAKARGFVERAGMVACFGLPRSELGDLDQIVGLSRREVELITSWSSPAGWGGGADASQPPPGLGKCLIKVGGRPGVPVRVQVTETERRLHDTNARWAARGELP
ncbi:MAG: ATP/GTP-binding protein [Streptosporangiaceae bacterium]|nr:ATP/GTP-binding protein [Streptosporangiaceae bacterium]